MGCRLKPESDERATWPRSEAGLFSAGPRCCVQPAARLGVEMVGLLCTGQIGKPVMANTMDAFSPAHP